MASLCLSAGSVQAYYTTNLASAFAAMGFDPAAPGNKVVVFCSDQHMCLDTNSTPAPVPTTNLQWQLVRIVNEMNPPPAKIIFAGDESCSLSQSPGQDSLYDNNAYGYYLSTNEMAYFAASVYAFTNIAQSNIVWIPGNHDQAARETNAETYRLMFPNMPVHQTFDVAGLRFFLFNSGNYCEPSDSERQWLAQQVAATSPTQEVAFVTHQQPLPGYAAQRGVAPILREQFGQWQNRWWVLCGHGHAYGKEVFNIGQSNVTQLAVGPCSTNTFVGYNFNVGFMFLCLSNGMVGAVYYRMLFDLYEVIDPPDWANPQPYVAPFETVEGLLWRRLKTHAVQPEVIVKDFGVDSWDWYAYPKELQWALPLARHGNQATHFVLLSEPLDVNVTVAFSSDRTNWIGVPVPNSTNRIYSFPIPTDMRTLETAYVRLLADGNANNWIAGWGLATTNGPPVITFPQLADIGEIQAIAGQTLILTNAAIDPYSPPDILKFTLLSGPPGALLDPSTGIFLWQPLIAQAPELVSLSVKVADTGTPIFSATQQVTVNVVRPAQPVFGVPTWSGQNLRLKISGDPGLTYSVMVSTNLREWSVLLLTNPITMPFTVLDPGAAFRPARFYRAVVTDGPLNSWDRDPDAQDFLNRAGITDQTQTDAVHHLALNAKAHGWWTNCDAIYPFVGGNARAHRENLRLSNYRINWFGNLVHDSNGVKGDGTNAYGNTRFNFKLNGVAYTTNSAHLFFYGGVAAANESVFMGGYRYASGALSRAYLSRANGLLQLSGLNDNDVGTTAVWTGFDFRGPMISSRTSSTNQNLGARGQIWITGATTPSTEPPDVSCGLLARLDQDGIPDQFSNFTLRGVTLGGGMTQAQWNTFRADWDAFEDALGRKAP
jgi:hypothetical protein